MAKGSYAHIILATADLDGAFARLQASGADVAQEWHPLNREAAALTWAAE